MGRPCRGRWITDMEGPAVKRFVWAPSISRSTATSVKLSRWCGRLPEGVGVRLTMGRLRRRIRLLRKSPVDPSACSSRGFHGPPLPQPFQRVDSPAGDQLSVATIEVVRTGILIGPAVGEDMVDGSEHGVGDGDNSLLVTSMAKDQTIAGTERAVIRLNPREGGLRQRRPEPAIALPGLPGLVFAGAFVVAGADARPTREMPGAWEDAHVHADLGDDHLRSATLDAVDGLKSGLLLGERRHQLL